MKNQALPAKELQIPALLSCQSSSISDLESLIQELRNRLGPVSRPIPLKDEKEPQPPTPLDHRVCAKLETLNSRLHCCISEIKELIDALEV